MSPPSYDGAVGASCSNRACVSGDGRTTSTPALNLSGGKTSGAAANSASSVGSTVPTNELARRCTASVAARSLLAASAALLGGGGGEVLFRWTQDDQVEGDTVGCDQCGSFRDTADKSVSLEFPRHKPYFPTRTLKMLNPSARVDPHHRRSRVWRNSNQPGSRGDISTIDDPGRF